ncbi:hypothetical protein AGMMS50229_16130 [Campylobacterota bacterium]|nr:hypothetical protein AGMMS50229_16130 [Campylobacterota bacterium]
MAHLQTGGEAGVMRVKQKNLRCFEVALGGDSDEFFAFVNAHEPLLVSYILLIVGNFNSAIDQFLREKSLVYAWAKEGQSLVGKTLKDQSVAAAQTVQSQTQNQTQSQTQAADTLVLRRTIRSGESIAHNGDAIIYARINNGAELSIGGNAVVFAPLAGALSAQGETAFVSTIVRGGLFVFHETVYDRLENPTRFFFENGIVRTEESE